MKNSILSDLLALKMQGADPMSAMQQLAQRYPQFQKAMPYLQGKSLAQMDITGRNFAQSMGLDPMQMVQGLLKR